jgi:hypothetical protein
MSQELARLRALRFAQKISIRGEEFWVRKMTLSELSRLEKVPTDDKTGFMVGCVLCTGPEARQSIPKNEDETDLDWGRRVMIELGDIQFEVVKWLSDSIGKLRDEVDIEVIMGN